MRRSHTMHLFPVILSVARAIPLCGEARAKSKDPDGVFSAVLHQGVQKCWRVLFDFQLLIYQITPGVPVTCGFSWLRVMGWKLTQLPNSVAVILCLKLCHSEVAPATEESAFDFQLPNYQVTNLPNSVPMARSLEVAP